jgi:hypothetical protein
VRMITEIMFLEGGDTAVRGADGFPGQNQSKQTIILFKYTCQSILPILPAN